MLRTRKKQGAAWQKGRGERTSMSQEWHCKGKEKRPATASLPDGRQKPWAIPRPKSRLNTGKDRKTPYTYEEETEL